MADIFDNVATSKGDIFDSISSKGDVFDKIQEGGFLDTVGKAFASTAKARQSHGVGGLETAANIATGSVSWIPAGIIKAAGAVSGQTKGGTDLANFVQDKTTYAPKSEIGKAGAETVAVPFEKISEGSQKAGDWTYEKTGSPLLATAVRTAGESIPFTVPYVGHKTVKVVKSAVTAPKIELGKISEKPYSITPEVTAPKDIIKTEELKTQEPIAPVEKVEPVATSQAETTAKPTIEQVKPIPESKTTVSRETPIEGDLKPHATALRVEAEGISKELLDREGLGNDIAKYKEEKGMMDAQAKMGVEIMDRDYNTAVKMALGEVPTPEGVRPGTMITAVTKRALEKGDYDTIYKLGTTEKSYTVAKEIAKDLKSFDQGLSDNPVAAIQSIVKARKEEAVRTGQKIDPAKQNAEIESLKLKLSEVQKRFDDYIASKKPKTAYGSQNKIITNAEYLKVKAELKEQFSSQLNAGLDPMIAVKLGKIGTYHLEAGVRTFAEWSARMIEDVGEKVKPHLEELWKKANEDIKSEANLKRYKTKLTNEEAKLKGKLENLDLTKEEKTTTKLDAEGQRLKDARDRIKTAYDAAIRKTGTVTREEAAQLLDLAREATKLKAKRDPNVKTNHGFSSAKERLEYGAAQVKFERYVAKLKEGDTSLSALAKRRIDEFKTTAKDNPAKAVKDLAIDTLSEVSDASISLVASLDNSFIGRQGMWTLMTHPTVWAKAASKSFGDIYKSLRDKYGNEVAKDILHADLVSRENYINGTYQKSGILAKFEEQYPTSHPARIPYIGRAFKASEVAFTNTALRMRLGTFDLLLDMAKKQGKEIDATLVKDIGDVVNSATARAKTTDSKLVKSILWAPKMIVANVNALTAHGLGSGLKTSFARKQAAYNLMKATGETLAVVAVLDALNPGSVETDPRSSDFLKYRDGNTRIDLTAGRGQYITLAARFYKGQTKNAQTKIIKELNLDGFNQNTYFGVGLNFLKNKTSPMARQAINVMEGKNFEGKKPTIQSTIADLTMPIPVQNFIEASPLGDYPDNRAITFIGNLADVFGINANTYQPLNQWETKNTKELTSLKKRVGETRFKELNIKYNKTVNSRIEAEIKKESYQKLSDADKQKRIEKIRRDVKNQII